MVGSVPGAAGALALLASLCIGGSVAAGRGPEAGQPRPNILFIIMDDVGIDQLATFGFGGVVPPRTPTIDRIASDGVRFSQVWAMPECSPSRAAFFTGRYPLRTGVESAIVSNHLPQSYMSSFETTLPRVLAEAGYTSAMIGKYHLGDQNDPAHNCAPATRGWDFFRGNLGGGPAPIDGTAGGLDPDGNLVCGFDQSPMSGACYRLTRSGTSCQALGAGDVGANTPARSCLERGGIFRTGQSCGESAPTSDDFDTFNAYYVWPLISGHGPRPPLATPGCTLDPRRDRRYMTAAQTDDAIAWWNRQTGPRMLTVSYNAIHTPYQQPPVALAGSVGNTGLQCGNLPSDRRLGNVTLEAMDHEITRLLQGLGLARLGPDGRRIARLTLDDTVIVLVGDNGTFRDSVKVSDGFSLTRSKATVYETGVSVPLIVAGESVRRPGRTVDELVNAVDLFGLFGDLAGIDVHEAVPPLRIVDSRPLLPYLTDPDQEAIRRTNYTETAVGVFDPAERSWPCFFVTPGAGQCSDVLFARQPLCEATGGVWYGPGAETQISSCCAVVEQRGGSVLPVHQFAVRDPVFKLVRLEQMDCAAPLSAGESPAFPWAEFSTTMATEFYDLTPRPRINPAGVDRASLNLLKDCPADADPETCLRGPARASYRLLAAELLAIQTSAEPQATCAAKGDGNADLRVDGQDLTAWSAFDDKGPSRYDIDLDGLTDNADLSIIQANLGTRCAARPSAEAQATDVAGRLR